MGKKTNEITIQASDKGGMTIERAKARFEELLASMKHDADGVEDAPGGDNVLILGDDYHQEPEDREKAEARGVQYYDLREGEGKSAVLDAYIRAQREHGGLWAIAPLEDRTGIEEQMAELQELESRHPLARWHFTTIDDGEPKPYQHNVIPNIVNHDLPTAGAHVVVVHTTRPRTKGKSSIAGSLASHFRDSAHLPLAGTVFDPRRYRRIK